MFCINLASKRQVGEPCALLLDALRSPDLAEKPVILVLNKCDDPSAMSIEQVRRAYHLDALIKHAKQKIQIIECSARTGQGVEALLRLLESVCFSPSSSPAAESPSFDMEQNTKT